MGGGVMDGYPGWFVAFVVIMAVVVAFALHMFGQGLWYMAAAEHKWGQSTERQRDRHQAWAYVVAFGGPVVALAAAVVFVVLA